MLYKIKINKGRILSAFFLTLLILSLSSCSDDSDSAMKKNSSLPELKLSFVIPNANISTRADIFEEEGSGYENKIDITGHDYRIYFFTYGGEEDETSGTLLAEFIPSKTTSSTSESETLYTVTGVLPDALLEVQSFRVVVLANWGNSYPYDLTVGTTTIDNLTEGANTTFLAENKFSLSSTELIPFYGVQEYTDVNFTVGETTELSKEVSLLRALAKIEIIINDDDVASSISDVILHNYNLQGYSAPKGIYLSSQYPSLDNDNQNIHLVDGVNNTQTEDQNFIKGSRSDGSSLWYIYVPEYDNSSTDYSYISLMKDDEEYKIYFADYENGGTDAYNDGGTLSRWDIYRNNLYRYYVDFSLRIRVVVKDWNELDEEELTF